MDDQRKSHAAIAQERDAWRARIREYVRESTERLEMDIARQLASNAVMAPLYAYRTRIRASGLLVALDPERWQDEDDEDDGSYL